jgi:hypothetical protein
MPARARAAPAPSPAATESSRIGSLTEDPKLFGFAQLDFAGTLAVGDGRYVLRDGGRERVLVLETLGAPPPPRRRRRRAREVSADDKPTTLPLTRATLVRAFEPFEVADDALAWLEAAVAEEEAIDALTVETISVLNQALHAHAVASSDPQPQALTPRLAVAARIGYGSGAEVANGQFSDAREIDMRTASGSRRQQHAEEMRPQERVAAALGGRESFDACETLILRARVDLDAGRTREAALQLRVGLEAVLAELRGALDDPGHNEDTSTIESRRHEAGDLANAALAGNLDPAQRKSVQELTAICERIIRRRRVLRS